MPSHHWAADRFGDGLEVTLAPGSPMPPVLVAGNGDRALRRAAAFAAGWQRDYECAECAQRCDSPAFTALPTCLAIIRLTLS
jgi:hypothetical protein